MHDAVTDWQELSALYEQADLLPADRLEPWLAALRQEAHPLLEPLLQMLGARAEILDHGFLDALPGLPAPGAALPVADWHEGVRIGPYRLVRPLGTGGMAEVWMAERDDGAFQRTVAIKLLFRHAGGGPLRSSFAQRFSRERDILASLHHPHIAALHDAGVTPAGQPWLALEYVEGEPLTTWCDRAKLDVRGRVELFLQVLLAVQHAHANLVIHRDLKPANILVTTAGEVRLLDFGIAKLMEAEGEGVADTELTRHAGRLMTVRYASPEQLTGQPLTTACDVYSLGVVLYELLCGELPYEMKVDSAAQLEQAILDVEPRAPSRRPLSASVAAARESTAPSLRKLLGSDLDAIVLRALAKQPRQRYASVEALRVELERWLAGEPVEARTPSSAYRLRKFVGRHVVGVSLGSAAVVALIAVAATAAWWGLQARQESARATAARDFMMGMFKQADSDKSHGADMTARQLLDRGRDDVLKRLKDQPELQADLLEGIAGIQSSMGEETKADVTYGELAKVYARTSQPRRAELAVAKRAAIALRMGNISLASSLVSEVRFHSGWNSSDPEIAVSIGLTSGWIAIWSGNALEGRDRFRETLQIAEAAFGKNSPSVIDALVGVVQSESNLDNFDAALLAQKDLAARQVKVVGVTSRDLVELDVSEAELLAMAGRYQEVVQRTDTSLAHCNLTLGEGHPMCRRLVYVRVKAEYARGEAAMTRTLFPALEALSNDVSSPDLRVLALLTQFRSLSYLNDFKSHPEVANNVRNLVAAQHADSLAPRRKVLALQELAVEALRRGHTNEARQWLNMAIGLRQITGDKTRGYAPTANTQMLIGITLLEDGRCKEAVDSLRLALDGQREVLGRSHPLVMLYSLNLAKALDAFHQSAEALAIVERAQPILEIALGKNARTYQQVSALRSHLLVAVQAQQPSSDARPSQIVSFPDRPAKASEVEFFY